MLPPERPAIYHIVHIDRLPSILNDGFLFSDAIIHARQGAGTTIGMSHIKRRRMEKLTVGGYTDLHVGDCVPFYFCPRSVMLFLIYKGNHPDLQYKGGQESIVHLRADLFETATWAKFKNLRYAFSLSNAGAYLTGFCSDLSELGKLDWEAIDTHQWASPGVKERKQAEFLVENYLSFKLIRHIGVQNESVGQQVTKLLDPLKYKYKMEVEVHKDWYY